MPDISTTFGFVFSVDDQATPGVERAQAAAEFAADSLENSLEGLTTTADSLIGSLGGVVGDAAEEFHMLSSEVDQLSNSLTEDTWFEDSLRRLEETEALLALINSGVSDFQVAEEAQEMAEAFTELGEGLELLSEQLIENDLPQAVEDMADAMGGATTRGTGFFKSIRRLIGSIGPGGLMAFILGPIAPILVLFAPLIALLTDTLLPIFVDFMGIIQNAFAPLTFILDTLLQSLIPDIQRLMAPIVNMLTFVAVDLGVQLQQMFSGIAGVAGPAMQAIIGLMPALQGIFAAIVRVGSKALPVFIDLLNEVVPVFVELAEILAEMFIVRMDILADMIEELGPDFVGLVGDVLRLLLPLVRVLAELGNVLLTEVFAPIFIPLLKGTLRLLRAIAPAVGFILTPVVELFDYIIPKLAVLGENWDRFMVAFPEVKKVVDGVREAFGEAFDYIIDKLAALHENWDKFLLAFPEVADLLGISPGEPAAPLGPIPLEKFRPGFLEEFQPRTLDGFAGGGIATGEAGVFGTFGEAGAEAVVPLDRRHLREFMEPALGDMSLAGLDEQTGLLGALVDLGREALARMDRAREERAEAGGASAGRHNIEADLMGGIGLTGLTPVGG